MDEGSSRPAVSGSTFAAGAPMGKRAQFQLIAIVCGRGTAAL